MKVAFDGQTVTIQTTTDGAVSIFDAIGGVGLFLTAIASPDLELNIPNWEALELALLDAIGPEALGQALTDRHSDHPEDDLDAMYDSFVEGYTELYAKLAGLDGGSLN